MPRLTPLEQFTTAYTECMLWSTNDESDESGGVPLEENYTASDIAPGTLERIKADCAAFYGTHGESIQAGRVPTRTSYGTSDVEYAGHDFWLTRNGHGAGFWDGDWLEPYASVLTKAAKACGELSAYVGDDGMIYL